MDERVLDESQLSDGLGNDIEIWLIYVESKNEAEVLGTRKSPTSYICILLTLYVESARAPMKKESP